MPNEHVPVEYDVVPVTSVTPHPRNVRHGDVGAITQSLAEFGQYRPIVVQRSTGHVLAGNHTLRAIAASGGETVRVGYVDVDDQTALRIMVADNRTAELATNDDQALTDLLREIHLESSLDGTGYDTDDLDELIRDLANPPDGDQGGPSGDGERTCPECGHTW